MYTDYMETNEIHEMACEIRQAEDIGDGQRLHLWLRWRRMFRERFSEPVEMMERGSQARSYQIVILERRWGRA